MQSAEPLQCPVFAARLFPFLRWWHLVDRRTLRQDLLAGLTGAVIVLPQGVAFAMIAGLPPVVGLYTAMVPPVIAALFGSSRHLVSGPTTAISLVVFATISKFAEPGTSQFLSLALTLTFLAGVYQLALGFARMGTLINFISHSVVVGFTAGAAVLIATSQLPHFFGIPVAKGESFLHVWGEILWQLGETNPRVLVVSIATLATALAVQLYRPRWPGLLVAMVVGGVLAGLLGGHRAGIPLVGEFPGRLPPLSMPDFSLASLKMLGSGALAVAMLGLVEAVSIARSVATRSGQRIDGSQEFIGQGLANLIGSFFSSYASSGSFTRSGLNFTAGAVTPLSAVFAAVSLLAIVLLVAPLAAHLPIPAMAGILLIVAYRLIDFHHIRAIFRSGKREMSVALTTFLATLFVELEFAIYVGVLLSLVIYLNRTSKPRIVSLVPNPAAGGAFVTAALDRECPQLKIVRIDGSLFFGAVDHVQEALHRFAVENPGQRHLLIIGNGINFVDIAGAELLVHEARRRQALGGGLYLSKIKDEVRRTLERTHTLREIGEDNVFDNKAQAIAHVFRRLDEERCRRCTLRIFNECAQVGREPATQAG